MTWDKVLKIIKLKYSKVIKIFFLIVSHDKFISKRRFAFKITKRLIKS